MVGYAAGFATGNVIGMIIEERLALGHIQAQIVSPRRGALLASGAARSGFGVTEILRAARMAWSACYRSASCGGM